MIDIENELNGYYTLGFLHIFLNTDENIDDLNKLITSNSKVFSTFLHEYIHFLQNFTTTSGMYSSIFYLQQIKSLVAKIKNDQNKEISLPLNIDNSYNQDSIIKLNKIYTGQSGFIRERIIYNNYYIEEIALDDLTGKEIKPKKFFVNFTNCENHKNEIYHLGSIALKEYVAHTIQKKFCDVQSPDIPYFIVSLIIEKEIPVLLDNENLIVILCEASLMTFHPAQFFFNAIENIRNNDFPKEPLNFYNHLLKNLSFKNSTQFYNNHLSLLNSTYDNLVYDLRDLFKSPHFHSELNWILHILNNAKEIRLKNPIFILELIDNKGYLTEYFKELIEKLGTPFFINKKNKGGFVPPKDLKILPNQIYLLLSASSILNNTYNNKGCNMIGFCNNNHNGFNPVNNHCSTNPFKKLSEYNACGFMQLCKTWGLHTKEYI